MNQNQFLNDKNKYESKQVEEVIDYRKKPKYSHIKWAVAAVCLLLIFIVVCIGIFSMTHEEAVVINSYDANCVADYLPPSPGKTTYTLEVGKAREEYKDENVVFLLNFEIFKGGTGTERNLSDEERNAEYQRLIDLGYELYTAEYWTYKGEGEKDYSTAVVGYFTESDLVHFKTNPEYGYMFRFVINGDGSGITVDENDLITEIQQDR